MSTTTAPEPPATSTATSGSSAPPTSIATEVQVAEYPAENPPATVRTDAMERTAMTTAGESTSTSLSQQPSIPTEAVPVELGIGELVRQGGFHAWFALDSVKRTDGTKEWLLKPSAAAKKGTSLDKQAAAGHRRNNSSMGSASSLTAGFRKNNTSNNPVAEALPPMIHKCTIQMVAPFETDLETAQIQSPSNNSNNKKSPLKSPRSRKSSFLGGGGAKNTNTTNPQPNQNQNQQPPQNHKKNNSSISSIDFSKLNPFAAASTTAMDNGSVNGENNNTTSATTNNNNNNNQEKPQYVLKCLSSTTMQDDFLLEQGIRDMTLEAEMMRQLAHPRLRATGKMTLLHDHANQELPVLILDKLTATLDVRLDQWSSRQQKMALVGILATNRGRLKAWQYFQERLACVTGICSALDHLHSQKIIYRNLKPESIGFDRYGQVQLMSFGLAKDLKLPNIERTKDGLYKLTGLTGNARYMPPEVALKQPYNEKCDVYSFALIMWQIMTLKQPYVKYKNVKKMYELVFRAPHARPSLEGPDFQAPYVAWIPYLLQHMWSPDIRERYSMSQILATLQMKQDELTQEYSSASTGAGGNNNAAAATPSSPAAAQ